MANNYTNSIDSEMNEYSEIDSQLTSVVLIEENAPIKTISVNGKNVEIINENVNIDIPKKTSDVKNDGDGESPFATEDFVKSNGGKIYSISDNGTAQDIYENKNVNIEFPENIAETDKNNNFSTSQTINGTLTVNGDIVQNGENYETHAEKVYTKNDTIILREGAVGGLGNNEYTGFEAEKYDGENTGVLGFGADGVARVGDKGNEQPLLTREESEDLTNGEVLVWNSETNRAEGSSDYVKNTDYATANKGGVVRINGSYGISHYYDGIFGITTPTEEEINNRHKYRPITAQFLDYAIKLGLTTNTLELTEEEKTQALNWLGVNDLVGDINTALEGILGV